MKHLGNAAHLLGIHGRDWDHLTVEETEHYLDWLDSYIEQMKERGD